MTGNDEITTAPANDDGGVAVADPSLFGSSFVVLIMDYEPRTCLLYTSDAADD